MMNLLIDMNEIIMVTFYLILGFNMENLESFSFRIVKKNCKIEGRYPDSGKAISMNKFS